MNCLVLVESPSFCRNTTRHVNEPLASWRKLTCSWKATLRFTDWVIPDMFESVETPGQMCEHMGSSLTTGRISFLSELQFLWSQTGPRRAGLQLTNQLFLHSWLQILASRSLNLRSSLNIRDQASQSYSTTGNIIVLYILIFKFLERSREHRSVWTE